MTIAAVTITPIEQPLADPTWRFATAGIAKVSGFILALSNARGVTGYGYARALLPFDLPPAAVRSVLEHLSAALPGREEAEIAAAMAALDQRLAGCAAIKSAIECALYDLHARSLGVPLCDLLGGARRGAMAQLRIVPLKPPEEMAAMAAKLAREGYRFLKVKASGDAALDLARVRAVRDAAGPAVRLMVDANQTYAPKAAIAAIQHWAEHGVELVEQPTPGDDLAGLAAVTRATPVAIEADESAQSLPEIARLAHERIVDSINLRIMNLGGIRAVLAAVQICESAGIAYRFGATFAPRLFQAQCAHVAATLPRIGFAHELAEFCHILDDPFAGLEVVDGALAPPPGPGCGVSLRAPARRAAE
jgi:L-alanine-DL-glutamate epimerase-like enolase superfamily enzyme